MTWAQGTDASDVLRKAIKTFIETWLADDAYKTRLPRVNRKVFLPGERQDAQLKIVIVTANDEQIPHVYVEGTHEVSEDFHRVAIVVKSDKKGGGPQAVSQMHAALKALFTAAMKEGTPECSARLAAGFYNLRLSAEGFDIAPGDMAEEGTFFRQDLYLTCSTDTFLN
jgi:hypothetical protein